jgi:hypothetical protein
MTQLAVDAHILGIILARAGLAGSGRSQERFTKEKEGADRVNKGNAILRTLLPIELSNSTPFLQDRLVALGPAHVLDRQSKEPPASVSHLLSILFLLKGHVP